MEQKGGVTALLLTLATLACFDRCDFVASLLVSEGMRSLRYEAEAKECAESDSDVHEET